MRPYIRMLTIVAPLLVSSPLHAQGVDPSGHWEGAIHAPFGDVNVAIDLAPNNGGPVRGTFSNPGERINGLPLADVIVEGRSVRLEIKAGSSTQMFRGELSEDGKGISGDFLLSVYAVPFDLKRTGEAAFEPAPKSPAIAAALAGAWSGTLEIEGNALEVTLSMTNHPDGTATGTWGSDARVQIPLTISHQGSNVSLASKVTKGSYAGTVNTEGEEIVGTFTEGALALPLTFHRIDQH